MGWLYGFKLHLIINDEGEILSFCLTSGNVDDRDENVMNSLTKKFFETFCRQRIYFSEIVRKSSEKRYYTLYQSQEKHEK